MPGGGSGNLPPRTPSMLFAVGPAPASSRPAPALMWTYAHSLPKRQCASRRQWWHIVFFDVLPSLRFCSMKLTAPSVRWMSAEAK